ncbi:hypothetical protein [Baaleninema simplex]|uniref:hypothetical protein n=1 Tax=Baaleninema simplex TaxID=2862350 RepID=UPI0003469439|nr:hypothetical protein [Baaleninema simplex]
MTRHRILAAMAAVSTVVAASPAFAAYWIRMGTASTGEVVAVDRDSIGWFDGNLYFTYSIGNEVIDAIAYCSSNQWYAEGYGTYTPQSEATQNMLNYVCNY